MTVCHSRHLLAHLLCTILSNFCTFLSIFCTFLGIFCTFLGIFCPFLSIFCTFLGIFCTFLGIFCPLLSIFCTFFQRFSQRLLHFSRHLLRVPAEKGQPTGRQFPGMSPAALAAAALEPELQISSFFAGYTQYTKTSFPYCYPKRACCKMLQVLIL